MNSTARKLQQPRNSTSLSDISEGGDGMRNMPDIWNAIRKNQLGYVKEFLSKNPEILNMQEKSTMMTPLHVAVITRNIDACNILFKEKELDRWLEDNFGRTPLDCAYETRDKEFILVMRNQLLPPKYISSQLNPLP